MIVVNMYECIYRAVVRMSKYNGLSITILMPPCEMMVAQSWGDLRAEDGPPLRVI